MFLLLAISYLSLAPSLLILQRNILCKLSDNNISHSYANTVHVIISFTLENDKQQKGCS